MRYLAFALLAACAVEPPLSAQTEQTEQAERADTSVCADGPTIEGIDVSRFQGTIDWAKVAGAGKQFAYIQISRSLTDIDAKFEFNWNGAKANGILRGAYQRFHPGQDAIGQADLFLDKLGPFQNGDLPPMLDVEDNDGLPAATVIARVRQWIDHVEPVVGVKPIIYTGFFFWRDMVGGADMNAYPLWIANYSATCPLVPPTWTRWAFHQYSSTVMVPGITENTTDVNKFNGTLDDLKALGAQPKCGDGTCSAGESADSCPAECRPCQEIGATGDVVDDTSACFVAGGDPQFIRHETIGYGGSAQWTHTTDNANPANFGLWNLHFAEAGTYRVEAFTPAPFNQSKHASYHVAHAGAADDVVVDQSTADGWHVLGEFEFAAGGQNQLVRLNDNTGEPNSANTQLVFDAIRFTRTDGPSMPGDGGMTPDPGNNLGGCSAGAGGAGLPMLLMFLGLRKRRRG